MRISSGAQPIPQEPGDDSGGSSGSPLTFSISLKSSSNLVPSAPPTFSLTSCGGRTGEGVGHCLDIPSSRWDTKGTAILAPRRGHEQPKALKKNPPNSQTSLSTQSAAQAGCSSPTRSSRAPKIPAHGSNSNACRKKRAARASLSSSWSQGLRFTHGKIQVNRE